LLVGRSLVDKDLQTVSKSPSISDMDTENVGNLIAKVPQGLSPDEFLMALSNLVEAQTREACAREIEVEVEDYDRDYREVGLELAALCRSPAKTDGL